MLLSAGESEQADEVRSFYNSLKKEGYQTYGSHLYHEGPRSLLKITPTKAEYATDAPTLNGYEILNRYFDELFDTNPKVVAFGEDVGRSET